jgi:hypothetical protein
VLFIFYITSYISAYTDRIINEIIKDKSIAITEARAKMIRDKLRGLYKHLKEHPALMERRLFVGSRAPDVYMDKKQGISSLEIDTTTEEVGQIFTFKFLMTETNSQNKWIMLFYLKLQKVHLLFSFIP